ncbi:MAG: hypothetical protein M1338_03390 [Patescibacteria group bacterium]|nr:hypothetical protein [Patescibacteria group bacterium]
MLNITFLFDFFFQNAVIWIINLFTPVDMMRANNWFLPLLHGGFMVLIVLISWFVFRSKLKPIFKAIYMTVPLAVVFVTIGIFFYPWPVIVYILASIFGLGVLYYFYRTKQPWIYYFTLILVSLALIVANLLEIEI